MSLTGPEILINLLFLGRAIAAICYGVIGCLHYSNRELWWTVVGVLTIVVTFWIDATRQMLVPFGDASVLFWSREIAAALLFGGWLLLAYKMGYLRKWVKPPRD